MNLRKWAFFSLLRLRGQPVGEYYNNFLYKYQNGISPDVTRIRLIKLLKHCEQQVPYYSKIIKEFEDYLPEHPNWKK